MPNSVVTAKKLSGLDYIPRWLGGVACYITFGLGGLVCSLTILPLIYLLSGSKAKQVARVQKTVSLMFKFFVAMLTFTGVIKVKQQNLASLVNSQHTIIIANHPTLVDVVVLISLMPNVSCVVKQGLWRNPLIRSILSGAGYIPNRGADLLLQDCQQVLDSGTNLIIFPEGTRTITGRIINPFARGAANIAIRTNTSILPIVLRTDVAGLTKQQSWYEIPRQTINMSVEVGKLFSCEDYNELADSESKKARQLTRELEQFYIQQLVTPVIQTTNKKN
ncbi:lysophospholipid acyltransferase family protein [Shewanella aestuarii]|uniref:1-acyl-sn-glycerol-3-phosphate acyltransferase n=1 Tax=Shewanella aestuarii TaxID=1028752 RepID=A0A6G9QFR1_9GAMM|nr:lysophospholipid acyltransferase family protein [Shewanella aestuarii]QIR13306.1 1-acyl-sn-glycerol-3-phosphate acyltransferase [Shewanella aestuarii]